tara:strand:+ start:5532 stop:7760 length:2229 start_codon:yes stop_codon:yes gene_type:complete
MADDFGWAFINAAAVQLPGGEDGSVQVNDSGLSFNGDGNLKYDLNTSKLSLVGDLDVAGNINANAINIDVTNKTITNLDAFGSTKFGDTSDDNHNFTGTVNVTGNVNASSYYGDGSTLDGLITSYANYGAQRLLTSVDDKSVNGEANLTFDGSKLAVTGEIEATTQISSSLGLYTTLTASVLRVTDELVIGIASTYITGDSISATTLSSTNLIGAIQTPAQPLITSVGNLQDLVVDSTSLVVSQATHRVGIGRGGPQRALDVLNQTEPQLRLSNTAELFVDLEATSTGYLSITPTAGRVGIMTSAPTEALDVNGNARITGNLLIEGTLSARVTDFNVSADTTTFGDAITDSIVINAGTVEIPNGINFDSNTLVIDSTNNRIGIGTSTPATSLEVNSIANQLKLSHQGGASVVFNTLSTGELDITPTGPNLKINSGLKVTGDTFLGTDVTSRTDILGDIIISGKASGPGAEFTNLTGSSITDGALTITGGNISSAINISATSIGGTLTTPAQANITSVGMLSSLVVDADTFVVKSTTHRVGIGRGGPQRKLDVMDGVNPQIRLSTTAAIYTDLQTTAEGYLSLAPTGARVNCEGDLHVNGTVYAEELKVKVTEVERIHLSSSGSTTFGDTSDDVHKFVGNVEFTGGVVYNRTEVTSNYTVAETDYILAVRANQNVTLSLPTASALQAGQAFMIKDELGSADVIVVTIAASGSDTIEGLASVHFVSDRDSITLYSDGVNSYHFI